MSSPKARDTLDEISPYQQGKSQIEGTAEPIKLSSNESAYGTSPKAIEAYQDVSQILHRYPDGAQEELRQAIAKIHQLPAEQIFCGNGSEELIGLVVRSYVSPGDEVILTQNHFIMSRIYATAQGAEVVLAEETNDVADVDNILEAVTERTRMVILSNPNNPTGTYVSTSELERLAAGLDPEIILVLDGAYAEYVSKADYSDGAHLACEQTNVVVTHTFSKIFGLAGLRIGWAVAASEIVQTVNRIRTPFNANLPAMAAASAAMLDQGFINSARESNQQALDQLLPAIRNLGFNVTDSVANFYLIDVTSIAGATTEAAISFFEQRGIIVRPSGDDGRLRITVGTTDENDKVIDTLTAYRASLS